MLDKEKVAQIINDTDIVAVVGSFVQLKQSGSTFKGLSPFVREKTPSFYVVPSKNIYKCFSSGKGGDVISFLMEKEGMSFKEAMKDLADRLGMPLEEGKKVVKSEKDQILLTNAAIQIELCSLPDFSFFSGEKYKLSDETQRKFGIGLATRQHVAAIQSKISTQNASAAGHLWRESGTFVYSKRVTIPIKDQYGNIVSFSGRAVDDSKPKYANGYESAAFNKSETLFGLDLAKQEMRRLNSCYVMEGYTDVMKYHEVGIKNVVASMGTSITTKHLKLISRYCDHIILASDGDNAGWESMMRTIPTVIATEMTVGVVIFPEGEDPCSWLAKGNEPPQPMEFDEFLKHFRSKTKLSDYIKTINEFVMAIDSLGNEITKQIYINQIIASI